MKQGDAILLRGVATNNLKCVNAAFPLGKLTVVTGVSGSGKSSLVFDSLYAEAYRRYVDSLSSYARQYLKALPRPEIAEVDNLLPSVAVQQRRSGATSRSTVGTLTEMLDLLRVLYAHLGRIVCHKCHREVVKDNPETIARKMNEQWSGQKVLVGAPLGAWQKLPVKELKLQLEAQGFTRFWHEGEVGRIADAKAALLREACVVADRITVGKTEASRLADSISLAMKAGRGRMVVIADDGLHMFSNKLVCLGCDAEYQEPSPTLMSHLHPMGACAHCQGFGYEAAIDYDRVIPDRQSSLEDQGVACWNFGKHVSIFGRAKTEAKSRGLDPATPFADYTEEDWEWLREGSGRFPGIEGYFAYLDRKKYKAHYRIHMARYRKYVVCTACHGARLGPQALAVKLGDKSLAQAADLPIRDLQTWLLEIRQSGDVRLREAAVADALEEADARIAYLLKVGVGYLNLNRTSRTLSGGELQRINMARSLGSALTDTLFCLDEPTAGLHPRDSRRLLEVMQGFKELGNTVVVVEHERGIIEGADHLLEIGPRAGSDGGELVYAGDPAGREMIRLTPDVRQDKPKATWLQLKQATTHNLVGVDLEIPLGAFTAVCGVSGSGKTSLIQHTLYPLLRRALGKPPEKKTGDVQDAQAKEVGPKKALGMIDDVLLMSQASLGRSSRSTIGTYLGLMDEVRKLFAEEPLAKKYGLRATAFSFNTKGGRCEECRGLGMVEVDLSFLGEMEVICPSCEGRRFSDQVLAVKVRDHSLVDILRLTITEMRELFYDRPTIVKTCDLVMGMGMGYLTLGQSTSSFSGGEAQRLKLLSLFREFRGDKHQVLIFDEPTTGLSDTDVVTLVEQFRQLTANGHTVVVVEHHLDVLRHADWLVEMGPDAGDGGGQIVYQGIPRLLSRKTVGSQTAPYLWEKGSP